MPISDDTLAEIREELESADNLDASRITVEAAEQHVVLRGSVPADHQVDVAATVAQAHAPGVRTLLEVDRGIREDAASPAGTAAQPDADESADGGEGEVRPSRRTTADEPLSTQTSEFRPQRVEDDLTDDGDIALAENLPWEPPDAPHSSPTASEQRGVTPREVDTGEPTEEDPDHEDPDPAEEPSLPDVSTAELARDARRGQEGER